MKNIEILYKKRLQFQTLSSTKGGGFWTNLIGISAGRSISGFSEEILTGIKNDMLNLIERIGIINTEIIKKLKGDNS